MSIKITANPDMRKIETCADLRPIELRFLDCLHILAEARKYYFNPYHFRRSLNSLIQATRNVTWILQSNKAKFEGFEDWYTSWQARVRDDKILKWLNEARVEVVKRGDLETNSVLRVSLVESWLSNPTFETQIDPSLDSQQLVKSFAKVVPEEMPLTVGLLRLERRWVDSKLPNIELLSAISHVLEVVSVLISDAHSHLKNKNESDVCQWTHSSYIQKEIALVLNEWDRTAWYSIKEGKHVDVEVGNIADKDIPSKEAIHKHYPEFKPFRENKKEISGFMDKVRWFYSSAKVVLARDKGHDPLAFIELANKKNIMVKMPFENRMQKHLAFEALVHLVKKEKGVSVIIIGDFWSAPAREPFKLGYTALEAQNKGEALIVAGISSSGEAYKYSMAYSRGVNGEIVFGEETESKGEVPNFLEPIHKLWATK